MKFPGRRLKKHFFPVREKKKEPSLFEFRRDESIFVSGLDQLLVDIEINVDDEFFKRFPTLIKGESSLLDDDLCDDIYLWAKENNLIQDESPGGTVGNTLHNFCVLSDVRAYALGSFESTINFGDYSFKYLAKTSGLVSFDALTPSQRKLGRAFCFISPDCERTFGISQGCMNDLRADQLNLDLIRKSSAFLISAYTLRDENWPIYEATIKACEEAKKFNVPVVMGLGTAHLAAQKSKELKDFIQQYVTVLAMNESEAHALLNTQKRLDAMNEALELVDLCMITIGDEGLFLGGYCDEKNLRETQDNILSVDEYKDYNRYEYSRSQLKSQCERPIKVMTHADPFRGGPELIKNTNGAGDAALSALIHDIAANIYHRYNIPDSPKHLSSFLTYSSFSQNAKYANRVSYEVIRQNSARLLQGLPIREDALEDAYWSR